MDKNDLARLHHQYSKAKNTFGSMDKSFAILDKYFFICGLYIPPSDSPYYDDEVFDTLTGRNESISNSGENSTMWRLNARTGSELDYIDNSGDKKSVHTFTPKISSVLYLEEITRILESIGMGKRYAHLCQP